MSRTPKSIAVLALLSLVACGGEGDEDDIESRTRRLSPNATLCVTSDDCLYGHCTTEDGVCYGPANCPSGASCSSPCYGACVASPSPSP